MKLVISKSTAKNKRLKAIFTDGPLGKTTTVNFGLKGGSTYLDHKDKVKRKNYRARHKKDLDTKDFKRAGFLSYYILWGDKTNLSDAVSNYKKRFNLTDK